MENPFDLPPDVLRRVPLFAEISKVLSWNGGPVNWEIARQIAVSVAADAETARPVGDDASTEAAEHVRLAELWLAEVSGLPAPAHLAPVRAASVVDWAERAPDALAEIVDPVAGKVSRALAQRAPGGDDPQTATISQALGQMAPMLLGIQAGTVIGSTARDVLGSFELGLPVVEETVLLIWPSIDQVAADYQLDVREVRQWVALASAARRLTLEGFPWVRTRFFALYHDYVASLDIDIATAFERLESLDLSDPERLRETLSGEGLFTTEPSPDTEASAGRLSTFLSILEAHAGAAVDAVARARLGGAARVAETFARRAAADAKGAGRIGAFVGLKGPARLREARAFAASVLDRGGWELLNRLWEEPDAFPTDDELIDPPAWMGRVAP